MGVQEKLTKIKNKPYKVTCLKSDYAASFETENEALEAKIRHQDNYNDHKVVVTKTEIINDSD